MKLIFRISSSVLLTVLGGCSALTSGAPPSTFLVSADGVEVAQAADGIVTATYQYPACLLPDPNGAMKTIKVEHRAQGAPPAAGFIGAIAGALIAVLKLVVM